MAYRLDVPIWVFDIDQAKVLMANDAACRLWQADTEDELCARDMAATMSATVRKRLLQYQADFQQSDASFNEMWTLYPNGVPENIMVVFRGFLLPDGRMAMQCEASGETVDAPENLRSAEALLYTDLMVGLFDVKGPALYLNPAARNAFPAPINRFHELFANRNDYDDLVLALEKNGENRRVVQVHTQDGEKWLDLSLKLCSDAVTGRPAILSTAVDVSALKEARDRARHLANRDQLTDLYNRTYLQNHLSDLARRASPSKCAIIFMDVDRFKTINDRYGHDAGDHVLVEIAKRIRKVLRPEDLIVRLGGDEMVALLEDVSTPEDIENRTKRIFKAVCRPVVYEKVLIDVGISIGIAIFSPRESDFTEVLREADIALYASKQGGRNRWTFFAQEMGNAAKERDDLEVELKTAIASDQFILHFQPRLDIKTGKIVSVEGLARWNHPERGLVPPAMFIPICEETGLIEELGQKVLEMGCKQAIAWQRQGLDIDVSLNVSPRQFTDDNLLETLSKLANLPHFPAGKIELEITENALVGDHAMIAEKLKEITSMGYRIAIDDFGTGYSNLSYISRFPLHCLKIDRSFIDQLPGSGPIIQLILTLGRQIGATVVSEGVETQEQLEWLTAHNCSQAQGYYISHPMPADDLLAFLDGPK